jgi:hypothetical protein
MAKLSRDLVNPAGGSALLHPRESLVVSGPLGSINAEVIVPSDSSGVVTLDLRGTFNLTVEVSGTIDGTNWNIIPVRPRNGGIFVAAVAGTAQGIWIGDCTGYRAVRARVSVFTSGPALATLATHAMAYTDDLQGRVTPSIGTAVGAAGAGVTLTLTAPGLGLRHYLTYIQINRFASALLVAAAAPVTVTTTNLPGTLAFSVPADAAAQGTMVHYREEFAYPIASVAQNTNTTIVCPVTTNVIWRVTAGFYVAP